MPYTAFPESYRVRFCPQESSRNFKGTVETAGARTSGSGLLERQNSASATLLDRQGTRQATSGHNPAKTQPDATGL